MPSLQIKIEESTVHLIRSNTNQDVREIIIIWSELFSFKYFWRNIQKIINLSQGPQDFLIETG